MSIRKTCGCATLIASVLVLAGCGDGGGDGSATALNPVFPQNPPPAAGNPPPVVIPPPSSSPGDTTSPPLVQNPGSTEENAANAVELVWAPPAVNVDGTPLDTLAGYRVLYGRDVENLDQSVLIEDPQIHQCVLEDLPKGTWYFAVVARNALGLEGPPSNIASKTII